MRPIDADALLRGKDDHEMISTHLIFNAPTLDVKPVIKGKWLLKKLMFGSCGICSICDEYADFSEEDGCREFDFCPHCGADMRESEG